MNSSRGSSYTGSWARIPIDLFGNFFKYGTIFSYGLHEDSKRNNLRMR